MAKVIFEFDDEEDFNDINFIVNRHKIWNAFYEIQNFRRSVYKGYVPELISVKDGKVITEEEFHEANVKGIYIEGAHEYISTDKVLNEIDNSLANVYEILDI